LTIRDLWFPKQCKTLISHFTVLIFSTLIITINEIFFIVTIIKYDIIFIVYVLSNINVFIIIRTIKFSI